MVKPNIFTGPEFSGKLFSLSLLSMMLTFQKVPFMRLWRFLSVPSMLRVYIENECWNLKTVDVGTGHYQMGFKQNFVFIW